MNAFATGIETAPVHHLVETGSTNEDALLRGRAGESAPFWIRADRQVAGRGRQGRVWQSPVGNLYCSLLVAVAADPKNLPQMSQVAAVALVEAIETVVGSLPALRIKWPNDILVGDAKVAGILVEATRRADGEQLCVIGCGTNCSTFPEGLPYRATSLLSASGGEVQPDTLFSALRVAMAASLATWDGGSGFATIRKRWLERALPLETLLAVRTAGEAITGRFQGIDGTGRLLLLGPHGPIVVEAGEVMLKEDRPR